MKQNRGQLILVGAILIALTIVASAVLLNSIHSSADLQSQQDRQALERTEGVITQIKSDLGKITVINESTEPVPYIDNTDKFEEAIEDYEQQYLNLSTRESNALINITYLGSKPGFGVWQNQTRPLNDGSTPWRVVRNPNSVTYVYINITSSGVFELETGGGDIEYTSGTVQIDSNTLCPVPNPPDAENPLEITIIDGDGVITRPDGSICGTPEFGPSYHQNDITIPTSTSTEGQFYLAYAGTDPPNVPTTNYRDFESGFVEPVFKVSYQDPQVYYESNMTIYGDAS